jgi:hypothetical protein
MALVKYNNNSISAITATGLASGAMTLIKEQTASASATISFVDGTSDVVLDNTYPIYLFKFINLHASASLAFISFQANAVGGSGYNETITSTFFHAYHDETGTYSALTYRADSDLAQGTSFCRIGFRTSNENDMCTSGEMYLFNPSSTTFVKHFITRFASHDTGSYSDNAHVAGYINTTSAIDDIQFKFDSGNIDSGTFKLYGIKDS